MSESRPTSTPQQTRRRAIVLPREHGAWGLLLVPLLTGLVAGFAPQHRVGELLLFTSAAVSVFALRTPLESLLGIGKVSARTPYERRLALIASGSFALIAGVCLTALMWRGKYLLLFVIGTAAASAFVMQTTLPRWGRGTRMVSQVIGAVALTLTAPAAYHVGTGRLDERALALWIANSLFAWNQIHFVQVRIQAARATSLSGKLASGRSFVIAQALLLILLLAASHWRALPPFSIIAFMPALVRGYSWFFQQAGPLDVRRLGWSEMKQGVAFGVLLAFTFLYQK